MVFLICANADGGLKVFSVGCQGGKLTNSEFLREVESRLSYLPTHQHRDMLNLFPDFPTLFRDVPSRTNVLEHDIDVGGASWLIY